MASVIARSTYLSFILRSFKSFPKYKLESQTVQPIRLKRTQNYASAVGLRQYSNQATEEAETLKEGKREEQLPQEKEVVRLLEENEKFAEKVKDLEDKYKRSLADNENIRTRMRREIGDAKQYGIQSFVKDLVEVADVLGKATESVPKEALSEGNTHLKSLFEGLQMTEAQLHSVLKRHGVFQMDPIGEKFNPNHHEALFEMEDSSKEAGTVGAVTKVGYRLHERCVRPAMVGVVKASKS
ncbi:grpE protein homolog, mitochondrial [Parasteatoda tepidariorum]|uniref:grpE protein homolog, mitochondrial n=1 Tax=Parasteatoda tepidariorum TaxID=114398 RepID=UPI0039BC71C9